MIDTKEEITNCNPGIISGPDLPMPKNNDCKFVLYGFDASGNVMNFARSVSNDSWNSESEALNYWWGMCSGVVDVKFSDKIPARY